MRIFFSILNEKVLVIGCSLINFITKYVGKFVKVRDLGVIFFFFLRLAWVHTNSVFVYLIFPVPPHTPAAEPFVGGVEGGTLPPPHDRDTGEVYSACWWTQALVVLSFLLTIHLIASFLEKMLVSQLC